MFTFVKQFSALGGLVKPINKMSEQLSRQEMRIKSVELAIGSQVSDCMLIKKEKEIKQEQELIDTNI